MLKGVTFFLADLIRQMDLPVEIDFMAISALGRAGPVRIVKDLDLDIQGRHVLLVEDIVDTGMTLRYLLGHLERWQPAEPGGLRPLRQADPPPCGRADPVRRLRASRTSS